MSCVKIVGGEEHRGCDYKRYRHEIEGNRTEEHQKCANCGEFLLGKMLSGVRCHTCDKIYHEECFRTDAAEEDWTERDSASPGHEDARIVPILSEQDFYVGSMDRQRARTMLQAKRPGSFLVRFSEGEGAYVVSKKRAQNGEINHEKIRQTTVGKVVYYWLEAGQGKTSMADVVAGHRLDRELFIPVYSVRADGNTAENEDGDEIVLDYIELEDSVGADPDNVELEEEETYVDSTVYRSRLPSRVESVPEEAEVAGSGVSWGDYNHGELDREAAERRIAGELEGSFLIRENKGGLRITRLPHRNGSQMAHLRLYQDTPTFSYQTEIIVNIFSILNSHSCIDFELRSNVDKFELGRRQVVFRPQPHVRHDGGAAGPLPGRRRGAQVLDRGAAA